MTFLFSTAALVQRSVLQWMDLCVLDLGIPSTSTVLLPAVLLLLVLLPYGTRMSIVVWFVLILNCRAFSAIFIYLLVVVVLCTTMNSSTRY
eukprot:COSAG02_NODE_842_length_16609_cov_117.586675_6_plen_91_part_00